MPSERLRLFAGQHRDFHKTNSTPLGLPEIPQHVPAIRPLFWTFTVAFNIAGTVDIILDYYHGVEFGLPQLAGQLGATYVIPIIYVPLLMITHIVSFYVLARQQRVAAPLVRNAVAS